MRCVCTGLALALLLACRESPPPPSIQPPAASAPTAAAASAAPTQAAASPLEACVDRWLTAHGLNQFGDPAGTVYAGGTPLFDEATGAQRDRLEYVFARQPQARTDCLAALGDAGATPPSTGR